MLISYQSVDLLNLLHGGLGGHRALEDAVLVQLVLGHDRLAGSLERRKLKINICRASLHPLHSLSVI